MELKPAAVLGNRDSITLNLQARHQTILNELFRSPRQVLLTLPRRDGCYAAFLIRGGTLMPSTRNGSLNAARNAAKAPLEERLNRAFRASPPGPISAIARS